MFGHYGSVLTVARPFGQSINAYFAWSVLYLNEKHLSDLSYLIGRNHQLAV